MILSLAPLTLGNAGPLETLAAAAAGGFEQASLRLAAAPGTPAPDPVVGNPPLLAELRRRLADTGITVFAATGLWLEPATDVEGFLPALAAAASLGATYFLAAGADPEATRLAATLGRLSEAAASFGVGIALEFMPYGAVSSLAAAAEACAASGGRARILVDALHLARSGGTPAAVAALPSESFAYLQICDAPARAPPAAGLRAESLTDRLYPGEGELPLLPLLAALPADLPIEVEAPVAADRGLPLGERARRAAAATRRLLARRPG